MPRVDRTRRHRRGQGSTYPDGAYWVAAFGLGTDPRTGRRRIIRRYATTEAEADVELARIRRRYEGVGPIAATPLDEYLADWLVIARPGIAARTFESYAQLVEDHVSPFLGAIRVGELRPADVRRLIADRLDAGLSPSSVHRVVGVLRMALEQAVRDGELLANVARVKLPRVEHERHEAMTPAQAEAILALVNVTDAEGRREWIGPIITLLLGTGLRLGEACALDWRDLSLAGAAAVTVRRGKTKASQRTLPLPAFVAMAMKAHRAASSHTDPDEPVFPGPKGGQRVTRSTVSHRFHRLQEDAGLRPIRVHDLRHGTATLLVARGVPMRVVAEVLGHADPAITARVYAHVDLDSKAAAMAEMDVIGRG